MNTTEELKAYTFRIFDAMRCSNKTPTITNVIESAKELYPNINFPLLKCLIKEYVCRESSNGNGMNMIVPDAFIWFTKAMSELIKPQRTLIPFATGLEGDIFKDSNNVEYCFYDKSYETALKDILSIDTIDEIPDSGAYNFIASSHPLDQIRCTPLLHQVEKCAKLLSDDGFCVFTFIKGFYCSANGEKWLSTLEEKGLYCKAIIDMPFGSYLPATVVDTVLAVFSKKKADKLFIGFAENDRCSNSIADNFIHCNSTNKNPKIGIFAEEGIRSYSDYMTQCRLTSTIKTLSAAFKGEVKRVDEIGVVCLPNENHKFEECENAVYMPKNGNGPVVIGISDFQLSAQNYFQIVLNAEKALPRYVAFFFNTAEGIKLRQMYATGNVIKQITSDALNKMVIPCPTIELQAEYLNTFDQLESLRLEVETLKDKLEKTPASYKNIRNEIKDINSTGDRFLQWIESLPYPIATILKRYSVADDLSKRQETLFYFYEAYAIFLATLMSAAINKKLIDCTALSKVEAKYFEKSAFGNWVIMDRALANLFLGLVNNAKNDKKEIALECFRTSDANLITLLCNKKIYNILEKTAQDRNTWKGHCGITSDIQYKEHVEDLDSRLRQLQSYTKDLYEKIRLIRPLSLSYANGVFTNKVEILTGSNPIFAKETIETIDPLDSTKLYMQIIDTHEVIELPPYFILKNSPAEVKDACYFYNRVQGDETRYVSYHFESIPEYTEGGQIAFDCIKRILS